MSRKAFTLIELLVVISIIGMLSSIAIVSTSGSRDKARLAATQSFAAQLFRTLGSDIVAQYDFEEGSGTAASDTSGNGNNGTLVGSPAWSTDTPYAGSRYSLNFGGSSYVETARGFGVGSTNFTIATWVKTSSANSQMYFVANSGSDWFRFGLSGGQLMFLLGSVGFTEVSCGTQRINDGKWHHVAGSFSRTSLMFKCYIDGSLAGSATLGGSYTATGTTVVRIGTTYCCSSFAGLLDDIRVYAEDTSGVSFDPKNMILARDAERSGKSEPANHPRRQDLVIKFD